MKKGALLALLCASHIHAGWCWSTEEEAPKKTPVLTVKIDELDQLAAVIPLLHKPNRIAQAFEEFKKLTTQNKISFLNVFFHINKYPQGSGLAIPQLQQIADAAYETSKVHPIV